MAVRLLTLLGINCVIPALGIIAGLLAHARWLVAASALAALIPCVLLIIQVGAARWAGRRRAAIAAVFPRLVRVTVLTLVTVIVLQTMIATAAVWAGESKLLGGMNIGIPLGFALVALGGALTLAQATLASARRPSTFAVGVATSRETAPRLFAHVEALADRLGAAAPRHIVVGVDPGFFVTSADVHLLDQGEPLRGETLYVSATLARLFTIKEFDAVVAHELGHFRGEDTAYSLRFAPAYAELGNAIGGMVDRQGRVSWLLLPALYVLGFVYDLFGDAEAAVGREREFEADRAGVEAAGAGAVARALIKTTLYDQTWDAAWDDGSIPTALESGQSIPVAFWRMVVERYDAEAWRERLQASLDVATAHPIDTHPPTGARLAAIGFELDRLDVAGLLPPEARCGADLIDDIDAIEAQLSSLWMMATAQPFAAPSVLTRVADGAHEPAPV